MDQWLVIGVSGVTCGGKTTLANNLYKYFTESTSATEPLFANKNLKIDKVHLISQDNYFLPVEDARHVLIEHLNHINWEIVSAIDMKRMCKDIMEVLGANFILYPTKALQQDELMHVDDNLFSEHHLPRSSSSSLLAAAATTAQQQQQSQSSSSTNNQKVHHLLNNDNKHPTKLNILIIEGFLIYNHTFTLDLCNIKFHLHLPYEKCYERRQKRHYEPPDVLGYFEMVVWPLYDKHCKEFANRSDILYLNGEVPRDKIFNFVVASIKDQL